METNCYEVIINGNESVLIHPNKRPCISEMLRQAKKGNYAELWYNYSEGHGRILVDFKEGEDL